MRDLGIVRPGATIRIPFSSFDKDDGSSVTMTNYAVADILIYKDGGTTERASTSGFTATTDFDSKTGKHVAVIDLADNTTSGFFNAGSEYLVGIDAVTVDGVTTGGWIGRFYIGYRSAVLETTIATLSSQTSFTLTTGPAEDDALNGFWAIIHDVASAVQFAWVEVLDYTGSTRTVTLAAGGTFTAAAGDNISFMGPSPLRATTMGRTLDVSSGGEAGIDWANIGSPTTTQTLSGTTVGVATTLTNAPSDSSGVTTLLSRLSSARAGYLDNINNSALATTSAQTGDAYARIGANGASLSAIPWNASWDAEVQSEVADALDAAIPGSPTANSINERIQTMDNAYTATRAGYLDNINNSALSTTAAQTGDSYARIGANGAGLSAIPWNSSWDAEVQSEVQDAIEVNHLDHLLAVTYDPASKPGASDALLNELVESDAGVARFTANALEQAPSGGGGGGGDATEANQLTIISMLEDIQGATFDTSTDSLEAIRNRGDAAWITATGFSTLDAAGVRSAIGLASANLDTQLDAIPTVSEMNARTLAAASYATASALSTLDGKVDVIDGIVDSILDDTGTSGVVVDSASKTGYRLSATGVNDILRTALTEGYAADGSTFTLEQFAYMLWSTLAQFDITTTTITSRRLDGSTSAMTFTLDSATSPTSRTRAS